MHATLAFLQERTATCVVDGAAVAASRMLYALDCAALQQPPLRRACVGGCAAARALFWQVAAWSACRGGQQARQLTCMHSTSGATNAEVRSLRVPLMWI